MEISTPLVLDPETKARRRQLLAEQLDAAHESLWNCRLANGAEAGLAKQRRLKRFILLLIDLVEALDDVGWIGYEEYPLAQASGAEQVACYAIGRGIIPEKHLLQVCPDGRLFIFDREQDCVVPYDITDDVDGRLIRIVEQDALATTVAAVRASLHG